MGRVLENPMRWVWVVALLMSSFLLSQCGYTLKRELRKHFAMGRPVFVPVFNNNTDETGAEIVFTNALLRELRSRRVVTVSEQRSNALRLIGTITHLDVRATAQVAGGFEGLQDYKRTPSEYRVGVRIQMVLRDPIERKVLWRRAFRGARRVKAPLNRSYDFQAPSSIGLITQSVTESVYGDVAREMFHEFYDEMVELF